MFDQPMNRFLILLTALLLSAASPARGAELVMVEQNACEWCETWNEEVGGIYEKTPEGRAAPLRRINIHDPLPADLAHLSRLIFTPTFVLVDKGKEIGRIQGYPGEDFFWGLLQQLLSKAGLKTGQPDAG